MYLDFFTKWRSNDVSSEESESRDRLVSVRAFLERHGIDEEAIRVYVVEHCVEYESPENYLSQHGVSEDSIKSPEDEVRIEANHRRQARSIILVVLAIQMLIIPIWLMVLLTLPVLNKDSKISQPMQAAILTAVVSDFAGLYYIITRDLFPQGNSHKPRRNKDDDD